MSLRQVATRLFHPRRYFCDKLWATLSVRWNGDVEPCPCANTDGPVFNVSDRPFMETWNCETYRKTRLYLLRRTGRRGLGPAPSPGEVFDICRNCPVPLIDRHSLVRWRLKGMGFLLRRRLAKAAGRAERAVLQRKVDNYARLFRRLRRPSEEVSCFPILGNVDPANSCNLKCPMCPVGTGALTHPRGMMTLETFSRVMDEVGPTLVVLEMYRYGEPLLNPRLADMIRIASGAHFCHTRVSTNLSMPLTDERIEGLIDAGLHTLIVAADGPDQATYEKYRRGGKIERVLENVERFTAARRRLKAPGPRIIWQYLVFSHNEKEIARTRRLAKAHGADRFLAVEPLVSKGDAFVGWVSPRRGARDDKDKARHRQVLSARVEGASIRAGGVFRIVARVRNTTGEVWPANGRATARRAALGIKVYAAESGELREPLRFLHEMQRGALPADLAPGSETEIAAQAYAPESPGRFRLKLDMMREEDYWYEWKRGERSIPYWLDLEVLP
ncbi:MAG TPA: radical SAM protein [Sumerlaeia bacterium]|nr:radical SAM protein [Sumerlaeia bacterium]